MNKILSAIISCIGLDVAHSAISGISPDSLQRVIRYARESEISILEGKIMAKLYPSSKRMNKDNPYITYLTEEGSSLPKDGSMTDHQLIEGLAFLANDVWVSGGKRKEEVLFHIKNQTLHDPFSFCYKIMDREIDLDKGDAYLNSMIDEWACSSLEKTDIYLFDQDLAFRLIQSNRNISTYPKLCSHLIKVIAAEDAFVVFRDLLDMRYYDIFPELMKELDRKIAGNVIADILESEILGFSEKSEKTYVFYRNVLLYSEGIDEIDLKNKDIAYKITEIVKSFYRNNSEIIKSEGISLFSFIPLLHQYPRLFDSIYEYDKETLISIGVEVCNINNHLFRKNIMVKTIESIINKSDDIESLFKEILDIMSESVSIPPSLSFSQRVDEIVESGKSDFLSTAIIKIGLDKMSYLIGDIKNETIMKIMHHAEEINVKIPSRSVIAKKYPNSKKGLLSQDLGL